jgi:hypothetical protein
VQQLRAKMRKHKRQIAFPDKEEVPGSSPGNPTRSQRSAPRNTGLRPYSPYGRRPRLGPVRPLHRRRRLPRPLVLIGMQPADRLVHGGQDEGTAALNPGASADTPVRDQGPGRSLPGPDAGHPLQASAVIL